MLGEPVQPVCVISHNWSWSVQGANPVDMSMTVFERLTRFADAEANKSSGTARRNSRDQEEVSIPIHVCVQSIFHSSRATVLGMA